MMPEPLVICRFLVVVLPTGIGFYLLISFPMALIDTCKPLSLEL